MDEHIRQAAERWLKSRGITITRRYSDDDVVAAMWQEICEIERLYDNGAPKFSGDGTLLDASGKRSTFDDVDA